MCPYLRKEYLLFQIIIMKKRGSSCEIALVSVSVADLD